MIVRRSVMVFLAFLIWPFALYSQTGQQALNNQAEQDAHAIQITGMVENSQGNPVSTAVVELHSWNGGLLGSAITDAAGRFQIDARNLGPFELRTFANGLAHTTELTSPELQDVVVRLPAAAAGLSPNVKSGDTVSLNDLEAPAKAKSELDSAEKAMRAMHLDQAWKLANQAIADAPQWGQGYLMRGVLSMQDRDYRSAQSDLGIALQRDPRSRLGLTEMGKLYAATGHPDLAEMYLKRALAIPPVLWPTYFEMGSLDLKRHDFAGAAAMAQFAIYSTPPPPAPAYFLAAEAQDALHNARAADQEYRSFLALTTPGPQTSDAIALARRRIVSLESGTTRDVHP